jgi:hypothetical protein
LFERNPHSPPDVLSALKFFSRISNLLHPVNHDDPMIYALPADFSRRDLPCFASPRSQNRWRETMILGHYASALVAKSELPKFPLWILLVFANLADFLWILLGLAGLEAPHPKSFLDASFANIVVQMTYSHDLIPTLVLSAVVYGAVHFGMRKPKAALWCAGLIILHFQCDLLAGYEHHVFGAQSRSIGLNFYQRAPHLALLIEAAFAITCVFLYARGMKRQGLPIPAKKQALLYGFFMIGILAFWPLGTMPLRQILHLG